MLKKPIKVLIPASLFILSGICWVLVGYLFAQSFNSTSAYPNSFFNFFNNHDNLIFILARLFLVLGIISLVYFTNTKNRIKYTAAVTLVILLGFGIFQLHENSIQKQALKGCLQAIGYNPEVTHAYVTPTSNSIFSGEVKSCYEQNGIKETYNH